MTDSSISAQTSDDSLTLYESKIGLIFRRTVTITHKGIHWKGRFVRFSDIASTGWGGTRHSYNGIPTGTVYDIHLDDRQKRRPMQIRTRRKSVYNTIVNAVWQHAGVTILNRLLVGLKAGEHYVVGSAKVSDEGIYIKHKKLFRDMEVRYYPWHQLTLLRQQGMLIIQGERGISEQLPYNENNNTHIIDYAIDMAQQHGLMRLSDMLPPAEH